jgi:hypothetical protein
MCCIGAACCRANCVEMVQFVTPVSRRWGALRGASGFAANIKYLARRPWVLRTYGGVGLKASDFGAHFLRAGFLTSAARHGASVFKMRDVSRHKSMDVLQAFVRDADLFRDHTVRP